LAESILHLRLIAKVITHIERVYHPTHQIVVFHDLPDNLGSDKPPRVEGFVPDVYAVDTPPSIAIIGEAKTVQDLLTDHSQRQLAAFLRFLRHQEHGILVLGVPWQLRAAAQNLLVRLRRENEAESVQVVIVDDVVG
jgi:hypothetical protein